MARQTGEEEAKNPVEHTGLDDIAALANSIAQKLPSLAAGGPSRQQCTIYKVPKLLRQTDVKCYEPELISIGPYHHGKESLQSMEGQKWKHLQSILDCNPGIGLEDYLREIKALEAQARSCYSESIILNSFEFVEMMLLDGCFLVEICLHITDIEETIRGYQLREILKEVWFRPFISHDMLLLENQIPYFILECIYKIVAPDRQLSELAELAREVCFDALEMMPRNDDAHVKEHYHHLLDLFHHHCLPPEEPPPEEEPENSCAGKGKEPRENQLSIPSAEELQEAGVKFKIKKKPCSFLDIKFDKSTGVMEIPYVFIGGNIDSVFRNLIAFEECYPDARDCFTGYAVFMNRIAKSAKDIKILHRKGILEHGASSHEETARFFDSISKSIIFDGNTFLQNQFEDVNEYCNTRCHIWRAKLMLNYFSSPWSILSLVAALVFLLLTFVQTFFTVFQYFRPP